MRWPRFPWRRPKPPPSWITKLPTFHNELREINGQTVAVPVLDDGTDVFPDVPPSFYGVTEPRRDVRVIQCNYAEGTKTSSEGARAYVLMMNNGNGQDRIVILARSRGGRFIRRYEDIRRLTGFRVKTIPPEHPLYGQLARDAYDYEPEEAVARLRDAREYWSTHTGTGRLRA